MCSTSTGWRKLASRRSASRPDGALRRSAVAQQDPLRAVPHPSRPSGMRSRSRRAAAHASWSADAKPCRREISSMPSIARKSTAGSRRALRRARQLVEQGHPVGQAGERVAGGHARRVPAVRSATSARAGRRAGALLHQALHVQGVADALQHLDLVEGLGEEIACAELQRAVAGGVVDLRGEDDDRRARPRRPRRQLLHDLEAAQVRHAHVEQDQVGHRVPPRARRPGAGRSCRPGRGSPRPRAGRAATRRWPGCRRRSGCRRRHAWGRDQSSRLLCSRICPTRATKLGDVEGFGHVVDEARRARLAQELRRGCWRRWPAPGCARVSGLRASRACASQPVHAGQVDVHQDEVGRVGAGRLDARPRPSATQYSAASSRSSNTSCMSWRLAGLSSMCSTR